jgi:hypothetical protein
MLLSIHSQVGGPGRQHVCAAQGSKGLGTTRTPFYWI